MSKVLIHISGLTIGDREYPKGVPVEANEVLTRMANNREKREGVVAVTFAVAQEAPKTETPRVGGLGINDAAPADSTGNSTTESEAKKNPMTMSNDEIMAELADLKITAPEGIKRNGLIKLLSDSRKAEVKE